MINSCLGKRPKVESMGNYMGITCLKIKHERIKRINNYMINYMGNYMAIICLKKNTRSATQGDACYRRDARIIINLKSEE